MDSSTISLVTDDGVTLSAHLADPHGELKGVVVVIQEIFGVNDHIRDVADRFAEAGYLAIAPALFDRIRPGVELGYEADAVPVGRALAWEQLDLAEAVLDVAMAARHVSLPGKTVGVVGFCWGGMLAARCAIELGGQIDAAVGYYPSRTAQLLLDRTPEVPLMLHVGEHDEGIPLSDVDAIEAAWPDVTVHRYDAGHGFNCDRRDSYAPEASATAWERTLNFFDQA